MLGIEFRTAMSKVNILPIVLSLCHLPNAALKAIDWVHHLPRSLKAYLLAALLWPDVHSKAQTAPLAPLTHNCPLGPPDPQLPF